MRIGKFKHVFVPIKTVNSVQLVFLCIMYISSLGNYSSRCEHFSTFSFNRLLPPLKYRVRENIMENGAFALLEQMLLFLKIFISIQNLT